MEKDELIFYAKYPFLKKSSSIESFISDSQIDVLKDSKIIEYAYSLVFTGVTERDYKTKRLVDVIKKKPFHALSYHEIKTELLAYPVSRMMLSRLDNPYYTGKFSSYYARRCMRYFRSDENDKKFSIFVSRIMQDLNLDFIREREGYKLHYTQYVSAAPNTAEHSLSNQRLYQGFVHVTENERYFLIEQAMRKLIAKLPRGIELPDRIVRLTEKLQKEIELNLPKPASVNVRYSMPPCIKKLINDLKAHKKLSHIERWVLAVYLNKKRMNKDSIIRVFSFAPNFDLNTTGYQLDYIIKRDYAMPSCKSMKTYGLCVAECGITSPLRYRKRQTKKKSEQ